jgi:hypothetical protein
VKRLVADAVFGSSDGLLAAIALVLATEGRGRHAVLLALFAVFIAEGLGMAVAKFLAKEDPSTGWKEAGVLGLATAFAILLIAVPWLVSSGHSAEYGSLVVALLVGAMIAQVRPGGWENWAQTLGLLAAVAAITGAVGQVR